MDPYCERCAVFHPRTTPCEEILERRATVTPIFVHQMRLDVDEHQPKVLCRNCEAECPVTALDEHGLCDDCAPTLKELLAESLRARGINPDHPSIRRNER